jgi:hypothetical protein
MRDCLHVSADAADKIYDFLLPLRSDRYLEST